MQILGQHFIGIFAVQTIGQYLFGIFDVQIFGRCSGYDSAAEEHLAKCQSEIRLHRRTLYFSLHCSTVGYVVSRKRNWKWQKKLEEAITLISPIPKDTGEDVSRPSILLFLIGNRRISYYMILLKVLDTCKTVIQNFQGSKRCTALKFSSSWSLYWVCLSVSVACFANPPNQTSLFDNQ